MDYANKRITQLRSYLKGVVGELMTTTKYQINANMLSNDIDNYSLDKIPTASTVEKWVLGIEIHRDVFSFRGRFAYSQDAKINLANIGFFEDFEEMIDSNNKKGILPEINGIESIECLNPGTLVSVTSDTAEFNIQIQIKYRFNRNENIASL
jgi:hypothetical protein